MSYENIPYTYQKRELRPELLKLLIKCHEILKSEIDIAIASDNTKKLEEYFCMKEQIENILKQK